MLRKTTADTNYNCYQYDGLHRVAAVSNNLGGATNPCQRFLYDNTSGVLGSKPSGVSISNPLGRLAEAETDTCAWPITQASIVTDEWFSYDADGRITDVYENTIHSDSTTYYHVTAGFFANGALNTP